MKRYVLNGKIFILYKDLSDKMDLICSEANNYTEKFNKAHKFEANDEVMSRKSARIAIISAYIDGLSKAFNILRGD